MLKIVILCFQGPHEPIRRRLNTNKAAARFRKVLAAIKWVSLVASSPIFPIEARFHLLAKLVSFPTLQNMSNL